MKNAIYAIVVTGILSSMAINGCDSKSTNVNSDDTESLNREEQQSQTQQASAVKWESVVPISTGYAIVYAKAMARQFDSWFGGQTPEFRIQHDGEAMKHESGRTWKMSKEAWKGVMEMLKTSPGMSKLKAAQAFMYGPGSEFPDSYGEISRTMYEFNIVNDGELSMKVVN